MEVKDGDKGEVVGWSGERCWRGSEVMVVAAGRAGVEQELQGPGQVSGSQSSGKH